MHKHQGRARLLLGVLLSLLLVGALAACGGDDEPSGSSGSPGSDDSSDAKDEADAPEKSTIKFAFSPGPYSDMFQEGVAPILEEQGYTVDVQEFSDFVQPNTAVANGDLDVNVFQHAAYLATQPDADKLAEVLKIPSAPVGIYSEKHDSLDDLADGMTITLPNDPTSLARSLQLLQELEVLVLDPSVDDFAVTERDVDEYLIDVTLTPVDSSTVPRTLADADFAVSNGSNIIAAGIPIDSALAQEETHDDYQIIVVVRADEAESQWVEDVVAAFTSDEARAFVEENYPGFTTPSYWQ